MSKQKVLTFEEFTDRNFFPKEVTFHDFARYGNFPEFWISNPQIDKYTPPYIKRFIGEHPELNAQLREIFMGKPIKRNCPEAFERLLYTAYVTLREYDLSDQDLLVAEEYRRPN